VWPGDDTHGGHRVSGVLWCGLIRGKNIISGATPFGAGPLDGVEPSTATARPMWRGAKGWRIRLMERSPRLRRSPTSGYVCLDLVVLGWVRLGYLG
jgi:hypothetical protein